MPPARQRLVAVLTLALAFSPALAGCASFEAARLYRSGTAALDKGEPERAVADLERAGTLAPQASEVQNHLGLAYVELGREAEAERAFRRALALDCDNAAAQANLRAVEQRAAVSQP
jgi:Flp pilus assembly protein TadD